MQADRHELETMDRGSMLHPFTNLRTFAGGQMPERVMTGGAGCHVFDADGRDLLDAFAGLYCVNIGYGRTEIADAIAEQARELAYYHAYAGTGSEPAIRLADRLKAMAPGNMARVFFGMSGSDANETQAKIVWYYNNVRGRPDKKKIISRQRAYHGSTVVSGSMTGLPIFHKKFDMPVGPIKHTSTPHAYWNAEAGMSERDFARKCADDLDAMIQAEGPETVAAFIGEPVLGTGGLIPPPEGYWQEIQKVLTKHDVLLIADEVVCGFGRLGTEFGCDMYGIEPDLVTVAKGLTSAYQPLSAAIVSAGIAEVLEQGSEELGTFAHGYTYTAHPTCAAAALANLDILARENVTQHVADVGPYLNQRMRETFADDPLVGEVRGVGMLAALEFVADKEKRTPFDPAIGVGKRISAAAFEENMIARAMPHGDILGFAPPLVLTRAEADDVVARTKRAVDRVRDELTREGITIAA